VRVLPIFRIREQVRALVQKVRRAAVFLLVLAVLAASLIVGKSVLLNEVRKEVRKTLTYDRLSLSTIPPTLVIENLRSIQEPATLRVRRVRIEIPFKSLLRNRKVLNVVLESPEFRVRPRAKGAAPRPPRPPLSILSLPFLIERGLIENGTFVYESDGTTVEARGVRALVTQQGENFAVRASAERSAYTTPQRSTQPLGALSVLLSGKGEEVTVDRLSVDGPGISLEAEGRLRNPFDPAGELRTRFEVDTEFLDSVLHLPFDWRGKAAGEGRVERRDGRLSVSTSLSSRTLAICGVPMGALDGRFEMAPGTGGKLEVGLQKPGRPAERLDLTFRGGRVEGQAAPMFVDPVFREILIPWPVKSPVWGAFSLEHRKLAVEAEFRDGSLERTGDRFAFRGGVEVGVDFANHLVDVRTQGLESSFGRIEAVAAIDLKGAIDARIRGPISDVRETRDFVSYALDQEFGFGEIRGRGYADVRLGGRSASPEVVIKATLSPGGFALFDAAAVEADVRLSHAGFEGLFDIEDPLLKGRVRVKTANEALDVEVSGGEGELSRILPALEVPVALAGRAAGDFRMTDRAGVREFSGTFTSPAIEGYGQTARNLAGRIAWTNGVLSFPELSMDFHGGRFDGRLAVGPATGDFDVDLRGEELDFRTVVPAAGGRLSLSLAGKGVFGRDKLPGLFSIKDMTLSPLDRTEARGDLKLDVSGGRALLELAGRLAAGANPFEASFVFPLSGEPFTGTVKGVLSDLDLVMPWDGAKGRLDYTAEVRGEEPATRISVALSATGPVLPLPGFAYALTDFTMTGKYADGRLSFSSIGGKLGGGAVRGSGDLGIGENGVATMDMRLEGKDMLLSPMERLRVQADATLRLLKDAKRFVTEGEIVFSRLDWRREIYEEFGFSTPTDEPETEGPSFFDGMTLNIRLRADENAIIENSLGRFNVRFDLTATGAFSSPVLLGDIDLGSGDFYFQDRSFRVIHGRLSFTDPVNPEPYLDFRGETYVKDYRVTLNMGGPVSRLKPEFSSSPPLPPEEILSLLALGESFRRMYYSYAGDRSTALNTASLLTYQIADLAKKRTGGLFSLDRFRIDPYIPESAPGGIAARITVGKKVSKNILFIYSTILANSTVMAEIDEVPIFRMEWEISRKFSLVGGRDDRGRFGFDVKFRKRF
jgi:hypothetical protein